MSGASSPWGPRQTRLALALIVIAVGLSPVLPSPALVLDQSRWWADTAVVAPFLLAVVVAGGIDLSCGSILALSGVTLVRLHAEAGLPMAWAALAGIAVGAAAGALNGIVIVAGRVPDLVVTLATLAIYRGLAQAVGGNRVYSNLPEAYRWIGEGSLFGLVPAPWLVVLAAWLAAHAILHWSRLGRQAFALGSSRGGARLARVPIARTRILLYSLSGLAAGVASVLHTARSNTARSDDAIGLELEAMAAVVLGGASIVGGRGSAPGVFIAVLCLGLVRTGLMLLGVPELWQRMTAGIVLIGVAILNERAAGRSRTG